MDKGYIPKGMKIVGDVEADGDLVLAGEVEGNVSIGGTLELKGGSSMTLRQLFFGRSTSAQRSKCIVSGGSKLVVAPVYPLM